MFADFLYFYKIAEDDYQEQNRIEHENKRSIVMVTVKHELCIIEYYFGYRSVNIRLFCCQLL